MTLKSDERSREEAVKKVLWITLFLNLAVAVLKIVVGDLYNYLSLSSSGLESFFDGSSNVLGLIAIHFSSRPADTDHNYGHHKYETLGSLVIASLIMFSAFQIAFSVYDVFRLGKTHAEFGLVPIISIILSMVMSFFVSRYEMRKGRELKSQLLESDAGHTYGDFVISGGVLASILASAFGFTFLDIFVGLVITVYLVYLAFKILKTNLPELTDASPDVTKSVLEEVDLMPEVLDVHRFRARGTHRYLYLDFHILLEPQLPLLKAHKISHDLEEKIRGILSKDFQFVDIIIHVEPYEKEHHDE